MDHGSRREVLRIAWPIGVSMVSMTLKSTVDTLMVASLGTAALAGVGFGGIVAMNALAFGVGMLRGQKSLVSQHVGAGDRAAALSYGAQAFHLAALAGALTLALSFAAAPLLATLAGETRLDAEALDTARSYLRLRLACGLPMLLGLAVSEYLRATGRPRLPMLCDLISHPLNVAFNWLLIFGHLGLPRLGAAGAAIGTGLADAVSLSLLLYAAAGGRRPSWREEFRFRGRRFLRLAEVGAATGVQFTLEVFVFAFITGLMGHLGTAALAAHQAALAVMQLSFLPAVALADGGGVLVGRYVGERRLELARRSFRSTLSLTLPLMSAMAALFLLFGRPIMSLYVHHDDPAQERETIRLAASVLAVAALWQIGDAFQITYRLILRAAGDHRWVMLTGILCSWLLSAPLAWLTVFRWGGGVVAVWLVWSGEIYAGSLLFWLRWRSGAWARKRLVEEPARPA